MLYERLVSPGRSHSIDGRVARPPTRTAFDFAAYTPVFFGAAQARPGDAIGNTGCGSVSASDTATGPATYDRSSFQLVADGPITQLLFIDTSATIEGTEPASGQRFEYAHADSQQAVTALPGAVPMPTSPSARGLVLVSRLVAGAVARHRGRPGTFRTAFRVER